MKRKKLRISIITMISLCTISNAAAISTQTYTEQLQSASDGSQSNAFTLTNITEKDVSGSDTPIYYGTAPVQISFYTNGEVTWHCFGSTVDDYTKYMNSFMGNPYYGDDIQLTNGVGYLAKSGIYTVSAGFRFQSESGLSQCSDKGYIVIISNPAVHVTATAQPNTSNIELDGRALSLQGYNINGLNYFKLRDVAMVLKDTNKKFQINYYEDFDENGGKIFIVPDQAYTPVGGELRVSSTTTSVQTRLIEPNIGVDGWLNESLTTAYNINGNNYYKLRDIAKALNFGVSWDAQTQLININTAIGYTN